jgi:hypothetical protein
MNKRLSVGDVVWVGSTSCGCKATIIEEMTSAFLLGPASALPVNGYCVRTEDGKEFWCPVYDMSDFSPLDILAANLKD